MGIKAISFDFWNTLFTEPPGGFEFYRQRRLHRLSEALRTCAPVGDDQIEEACAAEAATHYRIWREEHRTLTAAERVGKILTHLEVCLPDAVMAELVNEYEEGIFQRPPVLIAGVRETVEQLAGRYRLGLISDVGFSPGRVLKEMLRRAGLLERFDSMVFSDEAGRSKPHREVFERTARALCAEPHEIVHIGDLEDTDIVGAKNAGYYAVRFTGVTPMGEEEPTRADFVTADFAEVLKFLAALEEDGRNRSETEDFKSEI